MPPLGEPEEFDKYKAVLDEADRFGGCFYWKPIATEWVLKNLGCQPRAIELVLCHQRNKIEQKEEKREGWRERFQYWYRLVTVIDETNVFIESVFIPASGDKPDMISVVNVHEAN